jgi:hypothetical protein
VLEKWGITQWTSRCTQAQAEVDRVLAMTI